MTDCRAQLTAGVLVLENALIRREFLFTNGQLASRLIRDQRTGKQFVMADEAPDLFFPGEESASSTGDFQVNEFPGNGFRPAHLRVTVDCQLGKLGVRRVFRIYNNCPAIACDLYLKGTARSHWRAGHSQALAEGNVDHYLREIGRTGYQAPVIERLALVRVHLGVKAFTYFDISDRRNNMVQSTEALVYRFPVCLHGNLLLVQDLLSDAGLFVLKEAPCADVQLAIPPHDFACSTKEVAVHGVGIDPADLDPDRWVRGYGTVTGIASGTEPDILDALRAYQHNARDTRPGRDHMILLNTWGDRSQETKLGEEFALAELAAGDRLGITHFQLDDGWQRGQSPNWATPGGTFESYYDEPGYWKINTAKFPNGLGPVQERAEQLGIELCLWFSPCRKDDYAHWRDDANTLIGFYQQYGIRTFKIDSVMVPTKKAETNFRSFLERVMEATAGEAVFNLDVTAGRRLGYHFFVEYGNLFLENRYTDAVNYYPHWTLRNLGQLGHTVPPQRFQIEFLNRWRNPDKYPAEDPLAPGNVPFEYCFAVTMMAQPLAWFEATGLPDEAFDIADTVRTYLTHQRHIHAARIWPVGEEPRGASWTGFVAVSAGTGYVIVYRERTERDRAVLRLHPLAGRQLAFEPVAGKGEAFTTGAGPEGEVSFTLPEPWSYALFQYQCL